MKILIGKYEASIYPEGKGFTGAISLGFNPDGTRNRPKRRGRTKEIVKGKLKELAEDLESGIDPSEDYSVQDAVEDWLAKGLKGLDPDTIKNYRILAETHVIPLIGKAKLKELRADDVDKWLDGRKKHLSTRTLRLVHWILKRAIRQAQARDRVERNVADLVTTPTGKPGRRSRALTVEQANAVLKEARTSRLHAYVVVSLMTGIRTEEARALRWNHVVAWVADEIGWRPVDVAGFDHERFAIYVWRSVRATGDTKTEKSRRTLELPQRASEALKEHHKYQAADKLKAGKAWQDNGLVFCSARGIALDAANVRRAFRAITRRAGIGENWTPRELRHSFVSIMSDSGVPIENIADACGHASTAVTEEVYRHQLKPVITKGAAAMNAVFGGKNTTARPRRRRKQSVQSA